MHSCICSWTVTVNTPWSGMKVSERYSNCQTHPPNPASEKCGRRGFQKLSYHPIFSLVAIACQIFHLFCQTSAHHVNLFTQNCFCLGLACNHLCWKCSESILDSASRCLMGLSHKSIVKALERWPGQAEKNESMDSWRLREKWKNTKTGKSYPPKQGKIQELFPGFAGNAA